MDYQDRSKAEASRKIEELQKVSAQRGLRRFDVLPDPSKIMENETFIIVSGGTIRLYAKVDGVLCKVTMTP